jgi:transcriptional regulator with XRE-family HTH domain
MVKAIKKYRQAKGWSQSRLARESKVSQTYISELEAGKWTPNISILRKLANALEVPLAALLDEEIEGSDDDYQSGHITRVQINTVWEKTVCCKGRTPAILFFFG